MRAVYVTYRTEEENGPGRGCVTTRPAGLFLCEDREGLKKFIQMRWLEKEDRGWTFLTWSYSKPFRIFVDPEMWTQLQMDDAGIIALDAMPRGFRKRLPQYVTMNGGTALRHWLGGSDWGAYGDHEIPSKYWRDAGCWGVEYEWREDGLYSVSDMDNLNGVRLVETSREFWREDNAGYV